MEKPTFIDQLSHSADALIGRRGRVAMLIAGLAAMPGGCKASANASLNSNGLNADLNVETSKECDNKAKVIHMPDLDAVITLGTVKQGNQCKIDGLLYFSPYSSVHESSHWTREYAVPEEDHPWTKLAVEASGGAVLYEEENRIAVRFICSNLTNKAPTHCRGYEIHPRNTRTVEYEGQFSSPNYTDLTQYPDKTEKVDYRRYIIRNRRVVGVRDGLLNADFPYLEALAYDLAGQGFYKQVAEVMAEVNREHETKQYKKSLLVSFVQYLLDQEQNAGRVDAVEREVGIDEEITVDGGTDTITIGGDAGEIIDPTDQQDAGAGEAGSTADGGTN